MAETTASYTHTTAAVIHQQEAVTADKVNITLISKHLVFIGGLQWNGPLFFFFLSEKQDIYCLRPTCKNWCFVGP